jgi:hypothetical protein
MDDDSKDAFELNEGIQRMAKGGGAEPAFHVGNIEQLHFRNLHFYKVATRAGNLSATMDALLYCQKNDLKAPAWLLMASFDLLAVAIRGGDKKKGPGGNLLARYQQDMKHFVRLSTVDEVREKQKDFAEKVRFAKIAKNKVDPEDAVYWKNMHAALGKNLESAREVASKLLVGTAAAGSEETIASSLKLVRAAKPGRFKLPSEPVLRALDMAKRWDNGKPIHELLDIPAHKSTPKRKRGLRSAG